MSLIINAAVELYRDCSFEITDAELDALASIGTDMTDEYAVGKAYRAHLGAEINGVWFQDASRIADNWQTQHGVEITDWWPEGELPDRFFPPLTEGDAS